MKILEYDSDLVEVTLDREELVTLSNCINEALELRGEFSTRVGSSNELAKRLLGELGEAVNAIDGLEMNSKNI